MLGKNSLKILYISLELSATVVIAKLLSIYIAETFKEIVPYSEIFSLDKKIEDKKYELIKKSLQWLSTVENHLIIYDKSISANKADELIKGILSTYGDFIEVNKFHTEYKPKYENFQFIVVTDSVSLLSEEEGRNKKQEIDLYCKKLIWLRNVARITAIMVQQVNRNNQNIDRRKLGLLEFNNSDLADTSETVNASENVIAIFSPFKEKLQEYRDYKIIDGLFDRGRSILVNKSRFGIADLGIMTSFYGEIGIWESLPKANEIDNYEPYLNPKIVFDKSDLIKKEEKPNRTGFGFGGDSYDV